MVLQDKENKKQVLYMTAANMVLISPWNKRAKLIEGEASILLSHLVFPTKIWVCMERW